MSGTTALTGNEAQTRRSSDQKVSRFGYREYSKLISSDDDLFILRRFSVLNVRVTLALQNQLVVLERQLNELDEKYERELVPNGRFEGDTGARRELLSHIERKLREYSTLVQHEKNI